MGRDREIKGETGANECEGKKIKIMEGDGWRRNKGGEEGEGTE